MCDCADYIWWWACNFLTHHEKLHVEVFIAGKLKFTICFINSQFDNL